MPWQKPNPNEGIAPAVTASGKWGSFINMYETTLRNVTRKLDNSREEDVQDADLFFFVYMDHLAGKL